MNDKTQTASGFGTALCGEAQKAVLIVEDEKLVAWDIEQTLRETNHQEIFLATSVRGARDTVEALKDQLSLVILDLKLDDGDASVLIDEFTWAGIAVLVLTGYSGFVHPKVPVLHKPFTTNALLLAVTSLLAKHN